MEQKSNSEDRAWVVKEPPRCGLASFAAYPSGQDQLFIVGMDAVQDAVHARPRLKVLVRNPIHVPCRLDAMHSRHLTAERVVSRFECGRPFRSWQRKRDGEHNEALDTFVYAHAALKGSSAWGSG